MFHQVIVLSGFCLAAVEVSARQDWPEFRGPTGQGISTNINVPIDWSSPRKIAWKRPIPGKGWSSPILKGGRIYLTTAVQEAGSASRSLQALCLDENDGGMVWNVEVFQVENSPRVHNKNSHASPTPLLAGERLYVHFGPQGTACLALDGTIVWRNKEHNYAPVHGSGGSPILVEDALIFSCDGESNPYLVALHKDTGREIWRTERMTSARKKFSFSTPLLIEVNGQAQVISPGSGAVFAYDPKSGRELWRVRYGEGFSVIPRPVFGHGLVFVSTGYESPSVMAIRPGGTGDITETNVVWTLKRGAPNTPSMLLAGEELYMISDAGIASCLDAVTGEVHWQERVGGNYSASPVLVGDRIYFQNEEGVTVVVKAGRQFEKLATNSLDERTLASPAITDGALFLRTEGHLYKIQDN